MKTIRNFVLLIAFLLLPSLAVAGGVKHFNPVPPGPEVMFLTGELSINDVAAPAGTEIAVYDGSDRVVAASPVDAAKKGAFALGIVGPGSGPYRVVVWHAKTGEIQGSDLSFARLDSRFTPPGLAAPNLDLTYAPMAMYSVKVNARTVYSLE